MDMRYLERDDATNTASIKAAPWYDTWIVVTIMVFAMIVSVCIGFSGHITLLAAYFGTGRSHTLIFGSSLVMTAVILGSGSMLIIRNALATSFCREVEQAKVGLAVSKDLSVRLRAYGVKIAQQKAVQKETPVRHDLSI